MTDTDQIVIAGAGIAGISTAYYMSARHRLGQVTLVDPLPPLSLTSDKSTECYRNWWPNPNMVGLMNRSIDLMEGLADQSGNRFQLSRRGYLYVTEDPDRAAEMRASAERISGLGGGPLRVHKSQSGDPPYQPHRAEGYHGEPVGADLIFDKSLMEEHFGYLSPEACAALHVRRAGWLSGQQLGAYLLEQAQAHGARLVQDRVTGVEVDTTGVRSVRLEGGERLETRVFINAAGPKLAEVGEMLGVELPVFNELHLKSAFNDRLGAVPRQAPMLIWNDSQKLAWTPEERAELAQDPETQTLLEALPAGVHTRPEGGAGATTLLMLWEYARRVQDPVFPVKTDPLFAEIVLRGLAKMLPGLNAYFDNPGRPWVDGGYYTQTRENRPLIGRLPVEGAYVIGALSGFGLMAACAAGELLALHVGGGPLPGYAPAFELSRYEDPTYRVSGEEAEFGAL
jgi:sarcosine oxidase, subunit beta